MTSLTQDRGCDNVLFGQGYRTPHGAEMGWSDSGMMISGGNITWRIPCSNSTSSTTNITWNRHGLNPVEHSLFHWDCVTNAEASAGILRGETRCLPLSSMLCPACNMWTYGLHSRHVLLTLRFYRSIGGIFGGKVNSTESIHLDNLTVVHLVKKFPVF
jgi:hypothetical protein